MVGPRQITPVVAKFTFKCGTHPTKRLSGLEALHNKTTEIDTRLTWVEAIRLAFQIELDPHKYWIRKGTDAKSPKRPVNEQVRDILEDFKRRLETFVVQILEIPIKERAGSSSTPATKTTPKAAAAGVKVKFPKAKGRAANVEPKPEILSQSQSNASISSVPKTPDSQATRLFGRGAPRERGPPVLVEEVPLATVPVQGTSRANKRSAQAAAVASDQDQTARPATKKGRVSAPKPAKGPTRVQRFDGGVPPPPNSHTTPLPNGGHIVHVNGFDLEIDPEDAATIYNVGRNGVGEGTRDDAGSQCSQVDLEEDGIQYELIKPAIQRNLDANFTNGMLLRCREDLKQLISNRKKWLRFRMEHPRLATFVQEVLNGPQK